MPSKVTSVIFTVSSTFYLLEIDALVDYAHIVVKPKSSVQTPFPMKIVLGCGGYKIQDSVIRSNVNIPKVVDVKTLTKILTAPECWFFNTQM